MNPIEKALATANKVAAANKALVEGSRVEVWTVSDFKREVDTRRAEYGSDWVAAVHQLGERAHVRGDGVAIYQNEDLGSPGIGEWQVMSYGSEESQLFTRRVRSFESTRQALQLVKHGDDEIGLRLPDIGGRINWRFQLHAIVPSYAQLEKAAG